LGSRAQPTKYDAVGDYLIKQLEPFALVALQAASFLPALTFDIADAKADRARSARVIGCLYFVPPGA
jgi:hypothetical protein